MKKVVQALTCALLIAGAPLNVHASLFGEENIPLMKLVVGQIVELERLGQAVQIAQNQQDLLAEIHAGVDRAVQQIEAIQEILTRAQGLNPGNVRRMSDLTAMINETKELKYRAEQILTTKMQITDSAIAQSGVQAETSYLMGQEMISTGAQLANESRAASPGRAAQISAAADSAQMLSDGVALQTLAHIAQLTALGVDLQKTRLERELLQKTQQDEYFEARLAMMKRSGR